MNIQDKQEWQFVDEKLGILFPYYTKSFIDVLDTWHLKGKNIFEYGAGHSTKWYATKEAIVYSVDSNILWCELLRQDWEKDKSLNYGGLFWLPDEKLYINQVNNFHGERFDIIIIDGDPVAWRDGCILEALKVIKSGGIIIVDNWCQESVYMPSKKVIDKLCGYNRVVYVQDGHPDWETATFQIFK